MKFLITRRDIQQTFQHFDGLVSAVHLMQKRGELFEAGRISSADRLVFEQLLDGGLFVIQL